MFADILKTPRLVLRPPADRDAEPISGLMNNWNVVKDLSKAPYPYSLADAQSFLDRIREREASLGQVFAIALDDAFCGVISIAPEPRGDNLGYWLGEPYWGRGIMTEAGRAVVAEFFRQPQNEVLCSGIVRGNAASLAVQRKLGFKEVGESRIACVARGTEMPSIDTELTRQMYEELQA